MVTLITLLALLVLILSTTLVRYFILSQKNGNFSGGKDFSPEPLSIPVDPFDDPAFHRFRMALAMPTVTPGDEATKSQWHRRFQVFLQEEYPNFNGAAQARVNDDFGIWFRWPGRNPEKKPVLLIAHYDVVPVDEKSWNHEPFEAEFDDGYIYARGTLDTKFTLIALMEGVESLALSGFQPECDVYIAFGGDEERNGTRGAAKIAEYFASQDIRFSWVLDEGSVVADGSLKAAKVPLALVAVEEKGYVNLILSVDQVPGHSSRPPEIQAAAVLGRALHRIGTKPLNPTLLPSMRHFFEGIVPLVDKGTGFILANIWLFWPLLHRIMSKNPALSALFRTTMAVTMLKGSNTENVLPQTSQAVVNCRILPGQHAHTIRNQVMNRIRDSRVKVEFHPDFLIDDPVPVFPANPGGAGPSDPGEIPGWNSVREAITRVFPGCPVLPFLNTALTDSRHYSEITDSILRFAPMKLSPGEIDLIHGNDERISLENYYSGIKFYTILLQTTLT